ncbi:uncharacterized protein CDAR_598731 [Caerostris darwini]|uniref:Uncharacterized protein n=1 Tax=Caerostris darwini TaxID=1538125 RepID=A0AAV4R8A0_9ARAC|nr:uncharacterized protein CDAR_598731 [Caerostris darwini]
MRYKEHNFFENYQNGPPVFPPPTGAVVTPSTQTEPIDTYVEFLKVIDFAAEYNAKMGSKSKANRNQPSPKRVRCKAPTATSKSFSRDSNIKPKSINTHCGNMVRCSSTVSISQQLENVLDETLNRKKVKKWSQQDRHFDLSPCNFSDIAEPRRPRQGSSTTDSSETELHNPFEMNKEHEQLESLTKNSHSSSDTDTAEESSAFHVLASTLKDKESFSLLDFISTMRQVNARSPETKRSRRVSDTPKAHFDFDDYYEKLINMKNTYKSKADSNVSKLISDLTLKSAQIMLNKF